MKREELIRRLEALPYGMEIMCSSVEVEDETIQAHPINSIGTAVAEYENGESVIGVIYCK